MEKIRSKSVAAHFLRVGGILLAFLLAALLPATAQSAGTPGPDDKVTITGVVTDDHGLPLVGVYVFVENTTTGTTTDLDGEYSLTIPSGSKTIVFSCIGFDTQKFAVTQNVEINVVLLEETQSLDEVVVVGYGVQKKESSVAAITQVSGDDLANTNNTSIMGALQGQMPGVSVVQNSGTPGKDDARIMIRGVSSWVSSNPLVLVDGVERDYNNIDPSEIETMSVLKDASATAVFGVRGANGVILITTKRGKAGDVKVNFSSEVGMKQPINMISPMDSYTTAQVINDARRNDNDWGTMISDEVLEHYRTGDMPYIYTNTNWQDFMLKNGIQHKYNLNVSGGTEFARVFASLSYLHDGDVINTIKNKYYDPSYKYDRYNYRFNVDMNVTKTTLISVDAGGYIGFRNEPAETNRQCTFRPIFCLGPMDGVPYYPAEILDEYPDLLRPDETGMRIGSTDLAYNAENPLIGNSFSGSRSVKTSNLNLSIKLNQDLSFITEGLSLKLQASYNNISRWSKTITYKAPAYRLKPDGTWSRRVGNQDVDREEPIDITNAGTESMDGGSYPLKNYYYEVSINYNRTFGKHTVTGLIVGQRRETRRNDSFPSYEQGIAARATYDFANRYLFEANIGYNGSEQFAPGNQYGIFPSFAVGYNLHNEKFFQPIRKVVNRAKIRASWGQVGSDASGGERWLFSSSFVNGSGDNYNPGLPGDPAPNRVPIIEEKAANVNAGWEIATKRDIGFELSFTKNDMFVLSMDFYDEHRDGILLARKSVPSYAGISPKRMNLGETRTKGYEIELKFQYSTPDGDWYVFAKPSISFSDNRIINKDEPMYTPAYQKEEGYRIGQYFGYLHQGFIQDADGAFTAARYGGNLMGLGSTDWIDFNGDGIIDKNDMMAIGYSNYPLYNYGLSLGFTFRGLEFDMMFQAVSHVSKITGDNFAWPLHKLSQQVFEYQMDVWSPYNRDSRYPAYSSDANRSHNAIGPGIPKSVNMYDGSYIRLKNVNLAYSMPKKIISKIGLSKLKFFLRANNLFTYSPDYPLADPEASDSGGILMNGYYPMTRTYTFGLQVGF